ncbi:biosynthetic-type acetolactate synthase large subunit [Clostridium sp. CTA-7]
MIKVSDYIIKYLENIGVKDVFLLSGGGMMHLLDSVGRSKKINYYCNLNEQATSICADAYGQYTNDLAVCMVTTGPGATNAVTGVAASYLDSVPVLTISGQVKTSDLVGDRGVRQIGPQEINIVEMVKPITKYAVTITKKEEVKYHLDKAIYLAKSGRRGPVWIDVPLDIQGAQINEEDFIEFNPINEGLAEETYIDEKEIDDIVEMIKIAKRPVFLVGHGVVASNAEKKMKELVECLGMPALATWRAKMVFADDHDLYFGHPGSPGPRYSNFILQNSDLLIVIGTRLNVGVTAFNERNFAPKAKKVIVDIDKFEIEKLDMDFEHKIVCDANKFIEILSNKTRGLKLNSIDKWIKYCKETREKYQIVKENQVTESKLTNMYLFGEKLSNYANEYDSIVTASSGRSCGILNLSFKRKEGQVEIGSMGLGSMGFALPATIAACIASNKNRTITLEGDGSLQHNIQELALIDRYKLPIKLFVLNNNGYASIVTMQKNHFKGNFVACDESTGVKLTPLNKIAEIYNLKYFIINNNDEIDKVLQDVMKDNEPVICEILADNNFDEIPKAVSKVNLDGTISSSKLEELFPFLDEDHTKKMMSISK